VKFSNEAEMEEHICSLIKNEILPSRKDLVMFENKKVADVIVCKNGKNPKIFFLELKNYKRTHGRLGFGSGIGKGFQPEIVKDNPDYFEKNLRWILSDSRNESPKYLITQTSTIKKYLAGKTIGPKFNNIRLEIFGKEPMIDEKELVKKLKDFFE